MSIIFLFYPWLQYAEKISKTTSVKFHENPFSTFCNVTHEWIQIDMVKLRSTFLQQNGLVWMHHKLFSWNWWQYENIVTACNAVVNSFSYTYPTWSIAASIHSFIHTSGTPPSALRAKAPRIPTAFLSLWGVTSHHTDGELIRSKYFDVNSVTQSTYTSKHWKENQKTITNNTYN